MDEIESDTIRILKFTSEFQMNGVGENYKKHISELVAGLKLFENNNKLWFDSLIGLHIYSLKYKN